MKVLSPGRETTHVHGALMRPRSSRIRFSLRERVAAGCMAVGITTVVTTVIVTATNTVTAEQSVAMALSAGLTLVGGLLGLIIPDPWTAWRRGFRQGCEAALRCQREDLDTDRPSTAKPRREPRRRSG